MSRLDFFTIFVVALCILAIIFLILKATELAKGDQISVPEDTAIVGEPDDEGDDEALYDSEDLTTDEVDDELLGESDSDLEDATGDSGEEYNEEEEDALGLDEEEAETPAVKREPEVISTDVSLGKYLVLGGTFKIKSNADNHARNLRNSGYPNAKTSIFDKGTYAVVLVDRFDSKSAAVNLADKLKKDGHQSFVQAVRAQ